MKRKRFVLSIIAVMICCGLFLSHFAGEEAEASKRPETWAQPIDLPGVPNLHKINDQLYRSAQPDSRGMAELEKLGIKTIVNLRWLHSDRDEIKYTKLAYLHIPMLAWNAQKKKVVRFLRVVTDPRYTPVLVHCQHGADRTGMACAAYRVIVCGWTKDEAIREMTEGGFGFHRVWKNMVRFIRRMDIRDIKKDLRLSFWTETGFRTFCFQN